MGPYMSPIPANASIAMLFSFVVAVTVTPWLLLRLAGRRRASSRRRRRSFPRHRRAGPALHGFGAPAAARAPALANLPRDGRRWRRRRCACLFATKDVRVKLLPFDNKSEIQVVLDLPAGNEPGGDRPRADGGGRAAEGPARADLDPGLRGHGGAVQFQRSRAPLLFARRAAAGRPRGQSRRQGETLARQPRDRARHPPSPRRPAASRKARRSRWWRCLPARRCSPPCSPKFTAPTRRAGATLAAKVRKAFEAVDFVVDVDDSFPKPAERLRISIDQEALEFHGVDEQAVYDTIGALLGGAPIGYSQRGGGLKPIDISVALPRSDRTLDERLLSTPLPAGGTLRQGANVELGDVVKLTREPGSYPIFRHNGRFAEMVTRGGRRALRGADLRHARDRGQDRPYGLGRRRPACDQVSRPAGERRGARPCCGTANGRSPMSPSATWARPSWSRSSASIFSSSASSARSSCRWSS